MTMSILYVTSTLAAGSEAAACRPRAPWRLAVGVNLREAPVLDLRTGNSFR